MALTYSQSQKNTCSCPPSSELLAPTAIIVTQFIAVFWYYKANIILLSYGVDFFTVPEKNLRLFPDLLVSRYRTNNHDAI